MKMDFLLMQDIEINVRGTILKISKSMLIPDSALEAHFSGRHQVDMKDGRPFLDRDPIIFQKFLEMLASFVVPDEEFEPQLR